MVPEGLEIVCGGVVLVEDDAIAELGEVRRDTLRRAQMPVDDTFGRRRAGKG